MPRFRQLISVSELAAILGRDDCFVVDCRFDLMQPDKGREDYLRAHIPGARYADLDRDLAAPVTSASGRHPLPDAATFAATLRRLGIAAGGQVVAYDYGNGGVAARLWWMLRWLGHRDVAVLDGGFSAWCAASGATDAGRPDVAAGNFSGVQQPSATVTTEDVLRDLDSDAGLALVDAREAARYNGEVEPIDARAGHIPGALSLPFAGNLDASGHWRTADELRQRWLRLFDGAAPPEWAVMCGSGVTACHLALAADIAGIGEPRLYAGSWSEWIRDPARPIAP